MISFVKRFLIALIIIAVLYALNLAMSKAGLFGFGVPLYQVDLWKMAGINIILAVSLNLINGFTGQFSIGHIGFMAVGAYSSTFMTVYYTQSLEQSLAGILGASVAAAIVFALVIIIGALAAAVAGLIVGIPTLRLRGDYLAIATLGFAEIIRIVITNMNKVGGATGFRGCVDPITNITCSDPSLGRLTIPAYTNFFWIGFLAVITIVVIYNIVNSDMGRALISIREDELAAQAMGVNTTRYKVTSFVISSAFAGVAGALYGHWRLPHPNDFTFVRSFEIIIMIVLGGMGSITGAVLGALVITFVPEVLRMLPGGVYNYRLVIYALLLIIIMITRPQGILGNYEIASWLKRARKRPEGGGAIGGSTGAPIAEQGDSKQKSKKELENR
jgi:branched-chain amino acid transport system permease protein